MSVVTTLLALAFVGTAPSHPASSPTPRHSSSACVTPERTGTFRVLATKVDGTNPVPAMLLLENIEGCLEATFVTDDRGPAIIDHLSLSGDTLKGSLNVTGIAAQVTFRFTGNTVPGTTVAGSIIERRQEWRVEGRRTG